MYFNWTTTSPKCKGWNLHVKLYETVSDADLEIRGEGGGRSCRPIDKWEGAWSPNDFFRPFAGSQFGLKIRWGRGGGVEGGGWAVVLDGLPWIRHCEIIETFRFGDENDFEYEVWSKDFLIIVQKKKKKGLLHCTFFRIKVGSVIFIGGGKDLSWSQNGQTSNIW